MDEFITLPLNQQKIIYATGKVVTIKESIKLVDDDELYGMFCYNSKLKASSSGTFYRSNSIESFILYDKKTKKCRGKDINSDAVRNFLLSHFDPNFRLLILRFWGKITLTLSKKILTGKINCIGDFIKYTKSYTIKDKNAKLEEVYTFMLLGLTHVFKCIEDTHNIDKYYDRVDVYNNGKCVIMHDFPYDYMTIKPFKIKLEDTSLLNLKYEEWKKREIAELRDFNKEKEYSEDGALF